MRDYAVPLVVLPVHAPQRATVPEPWADSAMQHFCMTATGPYCAS